MKEKKYSIDVIPEIIKISPNELQKLLEKNSESINIISDENDSYLDEESFKRLVFVKQLNSSGQLSLEEVCELIKTPSLSSLVRSTPQTVFEKLSSSIDSVTEEACALRQQLEELLLKYNHALKELNKSRSKNIVLQKEVILMRNRQASLMGQLRQNAEKLHKHELDLKVVN